MNFRTNIDSSSSDESIPGSPTPSFDEESFSRHLPKPRAPPSSAFQDTSSSDVSRQPASTFTDAPVYRSITAVAPPQLGRFNGPQLFDKDSFSLSSSRSALQKPTPKEATPRDTKIPEITSFELDWMAPGSTVECGDYASVRRQVEDVLLRHSITASASKNEMKCTYQGPTGEPVVFYLCYFLSRGSTIVECRRWSGDCVRFNRIKKLLFAACSDLESDHAVVELEGPTLNVPQHEMAAADMMAAGVAFESTVGALLKEDAKVEEKAAAMHCLGNYGGQYAKQVLARSDLVEVLLKGSEGIAALRNVCSACGLELGESEIKGFVGAALPKLVAAMKRAERDSGCAYSAVGILLALAKMNGGVVAELLEGYGRVLEDAKFAGTAKLPKLAAECVALQTQIQCFGR